MGDDQADGPGGASSEETDTSPGGDGGGPSEESTADAGGGGGGGGDDGGGGGGGGGSVCTAATATSWSFGALVTARSATMLGRHPRLVPRAVGAGAFWVEQVDGASSLRYAALSASGAVQVGPVEVYRYVAPRPSKWDQDERMFDVAVASSGASFGVVVLDKRDDNLDVWFLDVAGATGAASGLKRITSTSGTPNDWTTDLSLDRRGTGFLLLRGDDCSLMGSPGHYCRYLTSLDASGAVVGSASRYVSHPGYHTMGMRLAVLGGTTFMPFKHDNYPAYENQAYMATVPTPNGGTGTIDPTQVAAGAQVDTALDVAASASTAALAWINGAVPRVRVFKTNGQAAGATVDLAAAGATPSQVHVAASSGPFGVAWVTSDAVRFRDVSAATGATLHDAVPFTTSGTTGADLAWTGQAFLLLVTTSGGARAVPVVPVCP